MTETVTIGVVAQYTLIIVRHDQLFCGESRHKSQEMLPNSVTLQTSPTLDALGICWQGMIGISNISFPQDGNDQFILSTSKLSQAN